MAERPPSVWIEARCGSVASVNSPNWVMPAECEQTAEGIFARRISTATKEFKRQGWKQLHGEWWCPACIIAISGDQE